MAQGGSAQGLSKSSSRRADQSLTEDFAGFREEDEFVAITGRGDAARTVLVQDRPGYIYVRRPIRVVTGTLEEYSEAQAFTTTEHRHGIPVTVRRSDDNPSRYEVSESWPIGIGEQLIEAIVPQTTPHRISHELFNAAQAGGNDPVFIETMQVKNLQTTPTAPSGLNVHVHSGFYVQTNNEVAWYTGTLVDMADFVPTGSLDVAFVSLWLDPVTDEIVKTNVTFADNEANLADPANYLRWPSDGSVPLATIRLTPGQSRITWADAGNPTIIDLRLSNTLPPGSSSVQGHALSTAGGFHTGSLDHGADLSGLTDDDHTNYALLAGRATGQTLVGGTGSGEDLTLQSTAHATKGAVILDDAIKLKASTILTLSTDAVTVTGPYHIIAAESGTADDLATITSSDDRTLLIIQADTGDTITVKDGAGNIQLNGGADFTLTGDATLLLFFDGTNWADVGAGSESADIPYIYIREEQSSGTSGGTFTSGSWQTRVLNTEVIDTGGHASLSSNQITLDAGTYEVYARAQGVQVNWHKLKLRNTSDSSDTIIGSNAHSATSAGTDSIVMGRFTIASSKTFELQHQCLTTVSTIGFGQAVTFSVVEVYAEIVLRKVA